MQGVSWKQKYPSINSFPLYPKPPSLGNYLNWWKMLSVVIHLLLFPPSPSSKKTIVFQIRLSGWDASLLELTTPAFWISLFSPPLAPYTHSSLHASWEKGRYILISLACSSLEYCRWHILNKCSNCFRGWGNKWMILNKIISRWI